LILRKRKRLAPEPTQSRGRVAPLLQGGGESALETLLK
jgi:hypothetical protein